MCYLAVFHGRILHASPEATRIRFSLCVRQNVCQSAGSQHWGNCKGYRGRGAYHKWCCTWRNCKPHSRAMLWTMDVTMHVENPTQGRKIDIGRSANSPASYMNIPRKAALGMWGFWRPRICMLIVSECSEWLRTLHCCRRSF